MITKFDEAVNGALTESKFAGPNERMTGISRHVKFEGVEDDLRSDAENLEKMISKRDKDKQLKIDDEFIEFCIDIVEDVYNEKGELDRDPSANKKKLATLAIEVLKHFNNTKDQEIVDTFGRREYIISLPAIRKYFNRIGDRIGIVPMTSERFRNIAKDSFKKATGEVQRRMKHGDPTDRTKKTDAVNSSKAADQRGQTISDIAKLRAQGLIG